MGRFSKYTKGFVFVFLVVFVYVTIRFIKTYSYQEFLMDEVSIQLPSHIKGKSDISCLIADLKYDGDSIKILELGNIIFSNVPSHEFLWGQGIIWKRFYDYVKSYGLQLWCIGNVTNPKSASFRAFEKLTNLGALRHASIKDLVKDSHFRTLLVDKNISQNSALKDFKGILAFNRYSFLRDNNIAEHIKGFLFLNDVVYDFANSKLKLATLFEDDALRSFRPQWKSYKKRYSKKLVEQIKNDFTSDLLVIKPTISTIGRGVIIVSKDDLENVLEIIFTKKDLTKNIKDKSYNYWADSKDDEFLVESFEQSKSITVDKKQYDPKMRVVFILSCDQTVINLNFIGSYWLCPESSLSDDVGIIKKHKSSMNGHRAKVCKKDARHVQKILSDMLPKMYMKMLERG